VLKGKAKMKNVVYPHPSGFKVVPSSMSISDLHGVDIGRLPSAVMTLYGKTDFVILDSAAGLGREAVSSMQAADEILLITNPDMPSVADALKTAKIAEDGDKRILGVVVNKVGGKSHEMSRDQIEKMLGHRVIAEIPEDRTVPRSIAMKVPVHSVDPDSDAAIEFSRLAHTLLGREFKHKKKGSYNVIDVIVKWMSK
jgi:septum site-determining protein MinD